MTHPDAPRPTDGPRPAWQERLVAGDPDGAWDALLGEYRTLMLATVRRLVRDPDDRMDAFTLVCERLRADDLRRLRRFDPRGTARFSTWLVQVVRNTVIDWHRRVHGRRRAPAGLDELSPLQQDLFHQLAGSGRSFVEAYESLVSAGRFTGSFTAFLREVRALHRAVAARGGALARELIGSSPDLDWPQPAAERPPGEDFGRALALLDELPPDVRLATLLFVVDEVPADRVAAMVGWSGRKMVYNRVHRALARVRRRLDGDRLAEE